MILLFIYFCGSDTNLYKTFSTARPSKGNIHFLPPALLLASSHLVFLDLDGSEEIEAVLAEEVFSSMPSNTAGGGGGGGRCSEGR